MHSLKHLVVACALAIVAHPALAATWQVSAALTVLQIDRASTASPITDREIVGIVVSVMDEAGKPVTSLKRSAFAVRAHTCAPHQSVTAENSCRLGKPLTLKTVREMEIPGTYALRTEDTYANAADEVLSDGVVVLQVYRPAIVQANQPAELRAQIVLIGRK